MDSAAATSSEPVDTQNSETNKKNNPLLDEQSQSQMGIPTSSELYQLISHNVKDYQEALQVMLTGFSGSFEVNDHQQQHEGEEGKAATAGCQESPQAPDAVSSLAFYLAEIRAANAQNELSRANKHLDKCLAELAELKKKHQEITLENQKLNAGILDAGKYVRDQYEAKLEDQRRETRKYSSQTEALRFELKVAKDTQEAVESKLVEQLKKIIEDEVAKRVQVEEQKKQVGPEAKCEEKKNNVMNVVIQKQQQHLKTEEVVSATTNTTVNNSLFGAFSSAVSKVVSKISSTFAAPDNKTVLKVHKSPCDTFVFSRSEAIDPAQFTSLEDRLNFELNSLRDAAKQHVLTASREIILQRILHLASQEVETQVSGCLKQQGDAVIPQYGGYKGAENFVRNECLFSGNSSVEKSFFLKCFDRHLAKAIDPVTGQLNKDLFYFTFHGTRSLQSAQAIQCEGYDPTRRSGQAMGPGEYQGVSNMDNNLNSCVAFTTSLGYSMGTVLVNLVFKPPVEEVECEGSIHEKIVATQSYPNAIKYHGPVVEYQGILVIKNPSDRKDGTYMLPLGCIYNVDYIAQVFPDTNKHKSTDGSLSAETVAAIHRTCGCATASTNENDE